MSLNEINQLKYPFYPKYRRPTLQYHKKKSERKSRSTLVAPYDFVMDYKANKNHSKGNIRLHYKIKRLIQRDLAKKGFLLILLFLLCIWLLPYPLQYLSISFSQTACE